MAMRIDDGRWLLQLDDRRRFTLPAELGKAGTMYRVVEEPDGTILMTPISRESLLAPEHSP